MKILGINALNHDAAITLIDSDNGKILFAAHAERYSGIKNDSNLNKEMFEDMEQYGTPDKVVYFERPWIKKLRQLKAGQYSEVFTLDNLPQQHLDSVMGKWNYTIDEYVDHHLSHASSTYFTSPYTESAVVCIDAIGEFDTITLWYARGNKLEKRYSQVYPHSLGLWYSAMTQRLDLKPQEDEYILMGMAGWGTIDEELKQNIRNDFFNDSDNPIDLKDNLHRGCLSWNPEYYKDDDSDEWKFNIGANVQAICEEEIVKVFELTKQLVPETDNCVYMGGVALNCVANSIIARDHYPNLWILPNPGDAGSSLGSAAYLFGEHINWTSPFTGYDIQGEYPIDSVLWELLNGNIVGVASGKAEFGPRALGNRSLLADPRGKSIKDKRGGDNNIHSWDIGIKGEVSDEQIILLNKHYPLKVKDCNSVEFQRKLDSYQDKAEEIYFTIRNTLTEQDSIFLGGYGTKLFSKYLPKNKNNIIETITTKEIIIKFNFIQ